VHLASLGHPIVCDALYGRDTPLFLSSFKRSWRGNHFDERPLIARLALHAAKLTLPTRNAKELTIEAPYPKDMAAVIRQIEKLSNIPPPCS
jgi:23S rRNA-/tRNA-specific pseudouridylate synthase